MKIYLALLLSVTFCATNSYAQATDAEADSTMSNAKVPNNKTSNNSKPVIKSKYSNQKPVTVRQVEKQTGGEVIGAKTINVHGKQLNQIKVLMPNGRIIIHEQLFDSNGRSVETVEEVEPIPEIQTK
jgi:hypothetical protein